MPEGSQNKSLPATRRHTAEREQLELFQALPGDLAPRDVQDLMAYPFFSLAKSKRLAPIDFRAGAITIRVEAVPDYGMATIWDADILIWAASQIVEARDAGLKTSRLMAATPYEILTFIGRGTGLRDYERLKAALDRLQSTTVATSIRQPTERRRHRFSWINEWKETADNAGRPRGLQLILPEETQVYLSRLEPLIDGEQVTYIATASDPLSWMNAPLFIGGSANDEISPIPSAAKTSFEVANGTPSGTFIAPENVSDGSLDPQSKGMFVPVTLGAHPNE